MKKNEKLVLKNRIKEVRIEKNISQSDLANLVGVSRNSISSIEIGKYCPSAKLALIICIALEKNLKSCFIFEEVFKIDKIYRYNKR